MIQPVRAKIFRDKCSSTCFITSRFSFASRSPYRIASFHICVIRRRSNQRPVSALSRKSLQNSAWGIDGVQRSPPGVNHWARWQPVAKFKRLYQSHYVCEIQSRLGARYLRHRRSSRSSLNENGILMIGDYRRRVMMMHKFNLRAMILDRSWWGDARSSSQHKSKRTVEPHGISSRW